MTLRSSIAAAQMGDARQNPDGTTTFEFRFNADDPVFAGHFPNHPILPGVFQLEMAHIAAERVLNCLLSVREIPKAKFQQPVLPGETVRVELKLSERDGTIQARAGFFANARPAGETILLLCRKE